MNRTALTLILAAGLLVPAAIAQQGPSGPPEPHPKWAGGEMGPGGFHGGMGILPFGLWWKNPDLAQKIGLTADQQKKMEDIFQQNRIQLIHMHASLEEAQVTLEPLLSANPLDTPKVQAQLDKIADLRADLEKANTHMLLTLRSVLTPDQWTRLQAEDREHRHGFRGPDRHPGEPMDHPAPPPPPSADHSEIPAAAAPPMLAELQP
ncbi:MAG: Spy/CpxP family protein refolding chaperone [Acidobacteriota bacterium]|nr:Spy/CpxP family protein refolding chaperone [Acidobacteriota bacterium]